MPDGDEGILWSSGPGKATRTSAVLNSGPWLNGATNTHENTPKHTQTHPNTPKHTQTHQKQEESYATSFNIDDEDEIDISEQYAVP